jgi:hypothetical protein
MTHALYYIGRLQFAKAASFNFASLPLFLLVITETVYHLAGKKNPIGVFLIGFFILCLLMIYILRIYQHYC